MPGQAIPDVLPIYPVKEQVVFPYMELVDSIDQIVDLTLLL
jgi:hypothetical protein